MSDIILPKPTKSEQPPPLTNRPPDRLRSRQVWTAEWDHHGRMMRTDIAHERFYKGDELRERWLVIINVPLPGVAINGEQAIHGAEFEIAGATDVREAAALLPEQIDGWIEQVIKDGMELVRKQQLKQSVMLSPQEKRQFGKAMNNRRH